MLGHFSIYLLDFIKNGAICKVVIVENLGLQSGEKFIFLRLQLVHGLCALDHLHVFYDHLLDFNWHVAFAVMLQGQKVRFVGIQSDVQVVFIVSCFSDEFTKFSFGQFFKVHNFKLRG